MSCEGVYKIEAKGPYSWESIGTAFMIDGKYLGGSSHHYSVGSYKKDGNNIKISICYTQYGKLRTVFGSKSGEPLPITYKCKIKKDVIIGTGKTKDNKRFDVMIRMTKMDDIKIRNINT